MRRLSLLLLLGAGCGAQIEGTGRPRPDGGANAEDLALPGGDDAGDPGGDGGNVVPGGCDNPLNLVGCACNKAGETRACYTGPAPTQGKGLCRDGSQTCIAGGEFNAWGPCTGAVTPAAEVCDDGKDHNCNGLLGCDDPECAGKLGCCMPGQMRACYSGPMGTGGVGPCKPGTQTCTPQGAWPPGCAGEVLPGVEAGKCADKIDNDCDGKTDCDDPDCINDPVCRPKQCQPGATKPCYTGPNGTAGVGPCKPGTQTCDQNGMWSPNCVGEVKPGSELFKCKDGIDNDCNGRKDCEDLVCLIDPACAPMVCMPGQMKACYSGPPGTQNNAPCKPGMQTCAQDGKSWGPCNGEVLPGVEGGHCNDNVDNDCNGLIDCKDPACNAAPNCCKPDPNPADSTIWAHSPSTLYRIDPNNWNVVTVGNFNAGDDMTDLAVTPDGNLYTISFTALYSVDKNTARAKKIGDVPGMGNNALTFLPDGKLLAADSGGWVKRINPLTGAVMDVGNYGDGFSSSGDMVAVRDGTMYGISSTTKGGGDASGNNVLLRIDVNTGKAVAVGPTGFDSVWGLAYANAKLIGFTNTGRIVQIDPQTGKAMLIANKGIQFWGAGMSPLVAPGGNCP